MAVYHNEKQITLIDGPCKLDLHTALSYAFDDKHPFRVEFVDSDKHAYSTKITSLSHEDGSGYSYMFRGEATGPSPMNPKYEGTFNVDGYFHTKSRKGWMTIEYFTADGK